MEIQFSVLVIGLNNSGKTTLLKSLQNSKEQFFPTASFSIEYIDIQKINKPILCYQCSGSGPHRANWKTFFSEVDAIAFVIDATDKDRFKYAKQQLTDLTKDYLVNKRKLPICIMLNKADKQLPYPKQVYSQALQFQKLQSTIPNKLYLKETSGYTKQGLEECFTQLHKMIAIR